MKVGRRSFFGALLAPFVAPFAAKAIARPGSHLKLDPTFIGKSHVLEDATRYVRRQSFRLELFAYETVGCAQLDPRNRDRILSGDIA
jgi:hypothetical protein